MVTDVQSMASTSDPKSLSLLFLFLFFISNKKVLLIKIQANLSTLECIMGATIKNQNYNDQIKQEGKNKKNATEPHSRQGEYVRKRTNLWPQNSHIQRQESLLVKLTRTH